MAITFSACCSPFTFSGSVMLQASDLGMLEPHNIASILKLTAKGPESSFQIHGSG
jgi:hypothetical protein